MTGSDYHSSHESSDETFVYDTLGNRITHNDGADTVYAANIANEYTSIGGTAVSYDAAGNLSGDHRGYTYEYDYENRLTAIMKDSGSTTVALFEYDSLGRRVESTGNTYGTYKFYYDGWRVLREERVASPTLTFNNEYVYGNYLDEVCMMNLRLNDAVQAYSYYFVHDHLYSTVAWLYSTSGIIHRYEYNAYGQRKIMNADYTDAAYSFNHISFTGQRQDDLDGGNLSLMYYKNRYYDTETGRFLTRDPIGYVDGMGLYNYTGNEPIANTDPYGLWIWIKVFDKSWQIDLFDGTMAGPVIWNKANRASNPFWDPYGCICRSPRKYYWIHPHKKWGTAKLWTTIRAIAHARTRIFLTHSDNQIKVHVTGDLEGKFEKHEEELEKYLACITPARAKEINVEGKATLKEFDKEYVVNKEIITEWLTYVIQGKSYSIGERLKEKFRDYYPY